MVIAECLVIIIRTRAGPETTSVINRLRLAQYKYVLLSTPFYDKETGTQVKQFAQGHTVAEW